MVNSFVGGICDAEGSRGYIELSRGEVVAVDLTAGAVLWRRDDIGRPVAAAADRLVTLDRAGTRFVLRLIDARSGADTGRVEDFGMPDWAAETGLAGDAVQIEASEVADGFHLAWSLRQPYRGGAPPPRDISSKAHQEAVGAVILDPRTSRVTPATVASQARTRATPATREASNDPSVLAVERAGDRRFALKLSAQGSGLTLEARDASGGTVLWELPLGTLPANKPTPQRK